MAAVKTFTGHVTSVVFKLLPHTDTSEYPYKIKLQLLTFTACLSSVLVPQVITISDIINWILEFFKTNYCTMSPSKNHEEPLIKRLARSRAMNSRNASRDASMSPTRYEQAPNNSQQGLGPGHCCHEYNWNCWDDLQMILGKPAKKLHILWHCHKRLVGTCFKT